MITLIGMKNDNFYKQIEWFGIFLENVKVFKQNQNRKRRYYIINITATDLVLCEMWTLKPNC